MPDLLTIERTLHTLFTTEAAHKAQPTGLVRRHSKLTGPLLLLILVAGFIQPPTASYNILAPLAADHGVTVPARPSRRASPLRRWPSSTPCCNGVWSSYSSKCVCPSRC